MRSPDGKYEVFKHNFEEVRMGSPEFGRIEIRGATFVLEDREFGEPMAFSPDSRFLASEELIGTSPNPHTRAIIFDFERRIQIIVHDQNPGFIQKFIWSPTGILTIVSWSHLAGEREHLWQSPAAKPPSSWWNLFR